MANILLTIGLLFVVHQLTHGKLPCQDYYFDKRVGGWLKFHPIPDNFEAAVLKCHHEGAILASPLDDDMCNALSAIMEDNRLTTSQMFTGISNIYESSVYQSMEGVPLSDICISWSVEPDMGELASESNCIAMNTNATVTAVNCTNRLPFTCYRKTGIDLSKCCPVENGFEFNTRTGSCYKAYNSLVTWPEAFKICAREGAHLAVVNSDIEAEVLLGLAKKVTSEPPLDAQKYVNIGFRAWGKPAEKTWITVHGQSLKDAGYDKWAPNEPKNTSSEYEWCGSLHADSKGEKGLLNDSRCTSYKFKFICEIDLNNTSSPSH
ncbi:hypothetical protein ABMA28_014645 [Loxostege sticticalis]|uniref:C-type lectin domain-containing protein n=1 Tax=Loxostege sticticalis TaxID=481309 RepID=A0ABD0TBR1_LOXSC